ncbi:hypothetical protein K3495_g7980 [Podosphaera aphanis]|nr:hypothetical protein K3495_g7980 [Podosphaera aphanis]
MSEFSSSIGNISTINEIGRDGARNSPNNIRVTGGTRSTIDNVVVVVVPEQGNRPLNKFARVRNASDAFTHVNRRYNIFDVPDNDEEDVQQQISLGLRATTRGLQSLETAGAAALPLPSPNMKEEEDDDDDDDVSGGGTAAGARPSYVANRKDGKHKSSAVAILDDPARIRHLINQDFQLCNSEGSIYVQGPRGKCARCAAEGISKANCGMETQPGAATVVPPPFVTRSNRVVKLPVLTVETPATGRAVRPKRRKTRSTTAGVPDTLKHDWTPRLLTGLQRAPTSDSLAGAIVPNYREASLRGDRYAGAGRGNTEVATGIGIGGVDCEGISPRARVRTLCREAWTCFTKFWRFCLLIALSSCKRWNGRDTSWFAFTELELVVISRRGARVRGLLGRELPRFASSAERFFVFYTSISNDDHVNATYDCFG